MSKDKKEEKKKRKDKKTPRKNKKSDDEDIKAENELLYGDSRFSKALQKPQFSSSSSGTKNDSKKVEIDDRFSSLFTDPRFRVDGAAVVTDKKNKNKKSSSLGPAVDKYGRKIKKKNLKNSTIEHELSAFYTIKKKEGDDDDELSDNNTEKEEGSEYDSSSDSDSEEEEMKKEQPMDAKARHEYLTALSRGEISASSSSDEDDSAGSDSDSSDSDSEALEDEEEKVGILDPSYVDQDGNQDGEEVIDIIYDRSPYLAIMNLDWEHVLAVDILVILNSFSPPGSVKEVKIYPSDFGMEQMKKEAVHGPRGIWTTQSKKGNKQEQSKESYSDSEAEKDSGSYDSEVDEDAEDFVETAYNHFPKQENMKKESDFDKEALRKYEASKLKYYFAIATFTSPQNADIAYKEVDGLEFEHSSSCFDLRCIPSDQLQSVVEGRKLKDEAHDIPSTYEPPDFIVEALQHSNVECTWEAGDSDRAKKLSQSFYSSSFIGGNDQEKMEAMLQGDDLRAYLASDDSSDESEEETTENQKSKGHKGAAMRKLLGLDDEDDSVDSDGNANSDEDEDEGGKEVSFIPGKGMNTLEGKIRTKLSEKDGKELTPWEKYTEKRKEKKKQRKAAKKEFERTGRKNEPTNAETDNDHYNDDDMLNDREDLEDDDFFVHSDEENADHKKSKKGKKKSKLSSRSSDQSLSSDDNNEEEQRPSTKEELELILAGDNAVENQKDYDMRGLIKLEKMKSSGKKLKGIKKRKHDKLLKQVAGQDFVLDLKDQRFAKVLDGNDERFGLDPQDSMFQPTNAMNEILREQNKRRRKMREQVQEKQRLDTKTFNEENKKKGNENQSESIKEDLTSLVTKLKTKVVENNKSKKKKKHKKQKQ